MPDLSPLQGLLLLLLIAVLLWFALGTQRNIKRGNDVLLWLQGGLVLLGERTTLRWLGSSAVQLNMSSPRDPLSETEVVVVLEPRDLGWLWAWSRRRGRRDFLIMRARLQRAPRFEIEVGDAAGWTGSDRLDRLDWESWSNAEWPEGVKVAHGRDADPDAIRRIWNKLRDTGGAWRLSVRRDNPHLEVHVPLGDLGHREAAELIGVFVELARSVISRD